MIDVDEIKARYERSKANPLRRLNSEIYLKDIEVLLSHIEAQQREIEELKAERDAAVEDIKNYSVCERCKNDCQGDNECIDNRYMNFDWRGIGKGRH